MKIVWSRSADIDLAEIYNYYAPRSTRAIRSILRRLFEAIDHLVDMPRMGKASELATDVPYRELIVDQYKVYYRIDGTVIYIVRVWDTRRDPTDFFLPDDDV